MSFQSADVQWYKVDMLLELGEWMYFNHLPIDEAQLHIRSAIDILLSSERPNPNNAGNSVHYITFSINHPDYSLNSYLQSNFNNQLPPTSILGQLIGHLICANSI